MSRVSPLTVPGFPLDTYGHVMDELDAARLATLDGILQARSSTPAQRPGLTVSSA